MSVYLDWSLSQNEINAAIDAVNAWNNYFTSQGYPAPYTFTTNGFAASITFKEDPQLHGTGYGALTMWGVITLNPDYQNRNDGFLWDTTSHEMGHAIGFTDVDANGCAGQSVMWKNIDPGGPYTTGPTSVDWCAIGKYYTPPTNVVDGTGAMCDTQWGCAEPIVFNLGNGSYQLSGLDDPVAFDIFGVGPRGGKPRIGWTERGSDIAFLAFDRNENGVIDSGGELFGNATLLRDGTHAANGFDALAQYDDNGDGQIDARDRIWRYLLLWEDRNHDGISQRAELRRIADSTITAIELASLDQAERSLRQFVRLRRPLS